MSLVAYEASSDEQSEEEEECGLTNKQDQLKPTTESSNINTDGLVSSLLNKLPEPKPVNVVNIQEEDDEFLRKKATPIFPDKGPKGPVQITIPALSEYKDVDRKDNKTKIKSPKSAGSKSCGLLDILPKPKQETFTKVLPLNKPESKSAKLIPDSIKNKSKSQSLAKKQELLESDEESDEDFFSLNSGNDNLPEVSIIEINAMVAKKAAKLAQMSTKLTESLNTLPSQINDVEENVSSMQIDPKTISIDEKALHILGGSRAKRRKMEEVNVVELSSAEVLPDKDEWLRTALASSTEYQPKGVLTEEEPAPGTRRKHQITYLAHQAKTNEMELQAMWATNRHTRRQTQSKYGF